MVIKLDLPADITSNDGEPLVPSELAEAAAAAVKRQADEATKGIHAFYDGWGKIAAQLGSLTRHGLEVGFRAELGDQPAVALVKATKENLAAGEIATLALEELGFDKGSLETDTAQDGKEYYRLELPPGKLVVVAFGPGRGWDQLL